MRPLLLLALLIVQTGCNDRYVRDIADGATTDSRIAPEMPGSVSEAVKAAKTVCIEYFPNAHIEETADGLDLKTENRHVTILVQTDEQAAAANRVYLLITSQVISAQGEAVKLARHDVKTLTERIRDELRSTH